MSRSFKDFQDAKGDKLGRNRKNLRNNGREAFKYFSGYDEDEDSGFDWAAQNDERPSIFTYRSVGKGVHGESSN